LACFSRFSVRAPPPFTSSVNNSGSSGSDRPAGSDSGRPAIDWAEARDYWLSLPPQQRTHQAVADRFGVSKRTVDTHAANEGWRDQLAAIEAEAAALAAAQMARKRADRLIAMEGLIDRSFARYGEQLDNAAVEMTPADFVRIANLCIAIGAATTTDEPASRTEVVREVMIEVRDALAADHPDALNTLREHFGEDGDGR
jgi:hypothetical protein